MGFFDKIKQGLKKTSDAVNHSLDSVFAAFVKVDDDLLEELEEALSCRTSVHPRRRRSSLRSKSAPSCARPPRRTSCATCSARC